MLVIPAVDIRGGKCVRLLQGNAERETVYADDPLQMARRWTGEGAQRLHVADLDGAFAGKVSNGPMIQKLLATVEIPVQVGGGIRDLASVRQLIAWGAAAVILGTVAVEHAEVVRQAVNEFEDRVLVSIDIAGDSVVTAGWTQRHRKSGVVLAQEMQGQGVKRFVITDTERDGTQSGVNIEKFRRLLKHMRVPVIVAGGVATLEDLQRLKGLESEGVRGVIIGKALYEGALELKDVLQAAGDQTW